jgi:SAM-dependent methyltransferase
LVVLPIGVARDRAYNMGSIDAGWSSLVARRAHNPKVAGSNPAPATNEDPCTARVFCVLMPHTVEADVLKPLPVDGPFDSAGLNGVLHCLPGPQQAKAAAVRNIASVLTPEGTLFGMTILGSSAEHTAQARFFLKQVNQRRAFDNLGDTPEGLRKILEESFRHVDVKVDGSVAHFTAVRPS